jgi:uncharacterized membrane-anchored protein
MSLSPQQSLQAAVAAGLLPADAQLPVIESRPWPVLLLTALGAWLAVIPLLLLVGLLVGDLLNHGLGAYLIGALVLGAALRLMRVRGLPLFVEQLALPGLLVGGGLLGFGLFRDLPPRPAALLVLALVLGVAWLLDKPWLRTLLGATAAALAGSLLLPGRWFEDGDAGLRLWLIPHLLLALWALVLWLQERELLHARRAPLAAFIEPLGAGWLLVCLLALCWLAGMTFLLGGVGGVGGGGVAAELARELTPRQPLLPLVMQAASALMALMALAGAALALHRWPGSRRPLFVALALVLAGLACLLPTLGASLFALAVLASSQRWRLAAAAGAAVAWIIGSFYYQLHWPLGQKALLLLAAGALLGMLAWLGGARQAAASLRGESGVGRWLLLAGVGLTLAVANGAIWQKERLIAEGRPVFVALAPVDPRSLMQGDFMQLNFALPAVPETPLLQGLGSEPPRLVARLDERGVATVQRLQRVGEPLAAGELLLALTPKNGRWVLVSDAWFFEEGRAAAFEQARFGEFRVLPDGRALLVGMADQSLRSISR